MTATARKETRSQILFKILSKRRRSGATVQDLAQGTGLKTSYMGSYLAEFKRVYGANVKYKRNSKRYFLNNTAEVKKHLVA